MDDELDRRMEQVFRELVSFMIEDPQCDLARRCA